MSGSARVCAVLAAMAASSAAIAQDAEPPPAEFLEYLGSWQEDDEEWFLEAELDDPPATDSGESKRKRVDHEQE